MIAWYENLAGFLMGAGLFFIFFENNVELGCTLLMAGCFTLIGKLDNRITKVQNMGGSKEKAQ